MGWYEAFKDVLSTAQKADNIELYRKILDFQQEMQNMQQRNFELQKENDELKTMLETKKNLRFISRMNYYIGNNGTGKEDGPFCSNCWDGQNKLIRLHTWGDGFKCPTCNTVVGGDYDFNYSNDNEDSPFG
jgi:hypothetical protein